jgi:hypothetical protein
MNGAWWDGMMPLDHYREEHGLDTESPHPAESLHGGPAGDAKPPTGVPAD